MATIEYPELIWADDIKVRDADETGEVLIIQGKPVVQEAGHSGDLLKEFQSAPRNWSQKHRGKLAPPVVFANADTDSKLRSFVARFGPVVAADAHTSDDFAVITARQRMDELRRERAIYAAVLELIHLQQAREPDVSQIRTALQFISAEIPAWVDQCQREARQRQANNEPESSWNFTDEHAGYIQRHGATAQIENPHPLTSSPVHSARQVIATLLNTFPVELRFWGNAALEIVNTELTHGIRPALYFFLRFAVLHEGRISSCGNRDCREFFEVERAGQEFCSADCSRRERQRDYWRRRGSALRRKRSSPSAKKARRR